MKVIRKDAAIVSTDTANTDGPGGFDVILSAPTLDRDGDTLLPDDWKLPLPEHITFDVDHGMDVASTVGSGTPEIDQETGNLVVHGTYSSLPRAQEVRTLVNEGHIKTTSVAFMSSKETKGGATRTVRELLNGAFVAVPSNREAVVLSSKAAARIKVGARNSQTDTEHIQAIHDHAVALGAVANDSDSASEEDDSASTDKAKKAAKRTQFKSVAGSLEATQDRISEALQAEYPGQWAWLQATIPDGDGGTIVFGLEDPNTYDMESYQQTYTDDGSVVTITGARQAVELVQVIKPDPEKTSTDTSTDAADAAAAAAQAAAAGKSATPSPSDVAALEMKRRAIELRQKITDSY